MSRLMSRAITVTLSVKEKTGVDPLGAPIYQTSTENVDGVLVYPASADDITQELNLSGERIQYNLCIPKGDTHNWRNATVGFFGQEWQTIGDVKEYIEDLCPLEWNRQISVKRYE